MKGYKAFHYDMSCMPTLHHVFQYEVGKEYTLPKTERLAMCRSGFHFCKELACVYNWYPDSIWTRVCEVEASGNITGSPDGCKSVTDTIHVVRELPPEEILKTMCGDYTTAPYEHKRRMVSILSNIMMTIDRVCAVRVNEAMRTRHVVPACSEPKALRPPGDRTLERTGKWLDALINHSDHDLVLRARLLTNTAEQELKELQ